MARTKFQLTSTPTVRGGGAVRDLVGKSHVFIEDRSVNADGTPKLDSDREAYVFADETTAYGYYVLGSALTKIAPSFQVGDRVKLLRVGRSAFSERAVGREGVVRTAPAEEDGIYVIREITPAYGSTGPLTQYGYAEDLELVTAASAVETFEKGDLVLVPANAKTSGGGSVYFGGAVVATVERTYGYGDRTEVDLTSIGGKYQTVGAQYLTKLPAGVELAEKVTRPELAFEDAIRKAATHRDAVEGQSSTNALIELAKLLVEVAK